MSLFFRFQLYLFQFQLSLYPHLNYFLIYSLNFSTNIGNASPEGAASFICTALLITVWFGFTSTTNAPFLNATIGRSAAGYTSAAVPTEKKTSDAAAAFCDCIKAS